MRQCVVTRERYPQRELLRFVVSPSGEVLFDARRKAPGRGVYVRATREVFQQAVERGGFKRGFKRGDVSYPGWVEWLEKHIVPGLKTLYVETLSVGRQSGQLIQGAMKVEQAMREKAVAALVLASDASAHTRDRFEGMARRREVPVLVRLDRGALGAALGREQAVVLCWLRGTLFKRAMMLEKQLAGLEVSRNG